MIPDSWQRAEAQGSSHGTCPAVALHGSHETICIARLFQQGRFSNTAAADSSVWLPSAHSKDE